MHPPFANEPLHADVPALFDGARQRVANAVNAYLTHLYWQVGRRLQAEALGGEGAGYGVQFIVDDALTREFYRGLCRIECWASRQLPERIGSMLVERGAISTQPGAAVRHELARHRELHAVGPSLLEDRYLLDFLGLNDRYLERDLKNAMLRDTEQFLLASGAGFIFAARRRRAQINADDFCYISLLF